MKDDAPLGTFEEQVLVAILRTDPDLSSERGKALRVLLYLFERDAAVKYWQSG